MVHNKFLNHIIVYLRLNWKCIWDQFPTDESVLFGERNLSLKEKVQFLNER